MVGAGEASPDNSRSIEFYKVVSVHTVHRKGRPTFELDRHVAMHSTLPHLQPANRPDRSRIVEGQKTCVTGSISTH